MWKPMNNLSCTIIYGILVCLLFKRQIPVCACQWPVFRLPTSYLWGTPGQHFRSLTVFSLYNLSAIKFALAFLFADDTKCHMKTKDTVDILAPSSRGH